MSQESGTALAAELAEPAEVRFVHTFGGFSTSFVAIGSAADVADKMAWSRLDGVRVPATCPHWTARRFDEQFYPDPSC